MGKVSITDLVNKLAPSKQPVSFTEFVTSPNYCNTEGIYPFWIDAFENLIKTKGLVPELILDGSLGGGKCVSGDSLILTVDGIRRIDDLVSHREGDKSSPESIRIFVEGHSETTSHTYYSPSKKALHLKFSDGSELKCSPHHPLKKFNGISFDWIKAEALNPGVDFVKVDYTKLYTISQFSQGYKAGILSTAVMVGESYLLRDVLHVFDNLVGVYGLSLSKSDLGYCTGPQTDMEDTKGDYPLTDDRYLLSLSLQNQIGFVLGVLDVHALISDECVILPGKVLNLGLYKAILNAFGIRSYVAVDDEMNTSLTIPIRIDFDKADSLSSALTYENYETVYEQENVKPLRVEVTNRLALHEGYMSVRRFLSLKKTDPSESLNDIEVSHESTVTKLVSVEEIECELFDLTNPESHSYRANGLVVHNTTLASFWIIYRIYNLFLDDDFRNKLKILDTSALYVLYFSTSLTQAKRSGFRQLINIVDSCKWFRENCPRDEAIDSSIRFPTKNFYVEWASSEGHQLSLDVIGFILDEANFRKGVGKGVTSEYLEAAQLYQQLIDRQISRFANQDGSMAFSVLVSSASYESSMVETRKAQVKNSPLVGNITSVAYKIKPWQHSKTTFEVFIGTGTQPPAIVTSPEHKHALIKGTGYDGMPEKYNELFVDVPDSLRDTYEINIRLALQNHSGVSVRSSGRLITNVTLISDNLFVESKPWFPFDEVTLSNQDDTQLMEHLILDNIVYHERPHAIHLDLSISGDTGGLSIYRNDSVGDKKFYHHVLTLGIVPPPFPAESSIQKVEDFIEALAQIVNVACVSADQYACLDGDTLIPTGRGLVKLRNVVVGDTVFSINGPRMVLNTFEYKSVPKVLVRTKRNKRIICTLNHKHPVRKKSGIIEWKETRDLLLGDVIPSTLGKYEFGHYELVNGLSVTKELAEYVGWLTGDGGVTEGRPYLCSNADEFDLVYKLHKTICPGSDISDMKVRTCNQFMMSGELVSWMVRLLGLSYSAKHKRVPEFIYTAPEFIVSGFLRGLFSSDGSCTEEQLVLTSCSKVLIDGVRVLLQNLYGIQSSVITVDQSKYDGTKSNGLCYYLRCCGDQSGFEKIGFFQEYKNIRFKEVLKHKGKGLMRDSVLSVEDIGLGDVFDIEVSEDNTYYTADFYTHNSKQLRQNLNTKLGLEDSRFSIDSSDQFYLHFLRLLRDKQTNLQNIPDVVREFLNALHDLKRKRVLKEDGETDDKMQSVVGAFFGCAVYTNNTQLPDVKRNLVGANSIKRALNQLGYK